MCRASVKTNVLRDIRNRWTWEYLITHSFVKEVCFSEASSPGVRSCNQAHWGCPKAQGVEGCLGPGIWLVTSVTLWYDIILSFIIWRQMFWSDTPFSISSGDSFSRVSFTNWMKLGEHCSLNIYKLEQVHQKWGQVEHKPRKNWKGKLSHNLYLKTKTI